MHSIIYKSVTHRTIEHPLHFLILYRHIHHQTQFCLNILNIMLNPQGADMKWCLIKSRSKRATLNDWCHQYHVISLPVGKWHYDPLGSTRWNSSSKCLVSRYRQLYINVLSAPVIDSLSQATTFHWSWMCDQRFWDRDKAAAMLWGQGFERLIGLIHPCIIKLYFRISLGRDKNKWGK